MQVRFVPSDAGEVLGDTPEVLARYVPAFDPVLNGYMRSFQTVAVPCSLTAFTLSMVTALVFPDLIDVNIPGQRVPD